MIRSLRGHLRELLAITAMVAIAVGVGGYILAHQRVRFPLLEAAPFELRAEFSTAQAVAPGQGQTVRVSGVRVGDIGEVELRDGRALVTLQLDPEYRELVHTDATALLRPKTGLKDMFVELDPGSAAAPLASEGFTIPIGNTLPDVNVDEVLAMLDADTRDYVNLLLQGAGGGLRGRRDDLREVLRRFEPTQRDLARVSGALAERRRSVRRLVHSLRLLSGELARHDDELAELVTTSAETMRAFASEEASVSDAVGLLPGALRETRVAMNDVRSFAEVLGPASERLRPAARLLDDASHALEPLGREAAPIVRRDLRPFVREARPLARELDPATTRLADTAPDITRSLTVLNRFFNMAAFNPSGREAPGSRTREEGFLFWLAWVSHNAGALFSSGDAHGTFRPLTQQGNCTSFRALVEGFGLGDPLVGLALSGLEGVFTDPRLCGSILEGESAFARRVRGEDGRVRGEDRR